MCEFGCYRINRFFEHFALRYLCKNPFVLPLKSVYCLSRIMNCANLKKNVYVCPRKRHPPDMILICHAFFRCHCLLTQWKRMDAMKTRTIRPLKIFYSENVVNIFLQSVCRMSFSHIIFKVSSISWSSKFVCDISCDNRHYFFPNDCIHFHALFIT